MKYFIFMMILVLSTSLFGKAYTIKEEMRIVKSAGISDEDLKILTNDLYNDIINSDLIKQMLKKNKNRIVVEFGKFSLKLCFHLNTSIIKSNLKMKFMKNRTFWVRAEERQRKAMKQERKGHKGKSKIINPDFIISGKIYSELKKLKNEKAKVRFILDYKLVKPKTNKVIYSNKVFSEKTLNTKLKPNTSNKK